MDFRDVLLVASEQQGGSAPPKRYSLAVGPPKKVPKVRGVESAAVQAFLRRKEEEKKKKEREEKKRKEELLAKRVELKHDRKARAMASRTKDNFYGYNGIPIEEKPRKRRTSENVSRGTDAEYTTGDETEQFEYSQTESEHEPEEYEEKPSKATAKPKAPPKSAVAPMNFTDLLRLAEKKQYEPVEIKVVKKIEERPRTAEELREREFLERKNKKGEMQKEKKKPEKEIKNIAASGSSKKVCSQKELVNAKLSKASADKHSSSKGSFSSISCSDKKSRAPAFTEKHSRPSSSSKYSQVEKTKPAQNGSLKSSSSFSHSKPPVNGIGKSGSSSHAFISKATANGTQKLLPAKEPSVKKSASAHTKQGVAAPSQHEASSSAKRPGSSSGSGGTGRPSSSSGMGPARSGGSSVPIHPSSSLSMGLGRSGGSAGMGPGRPGSSSSTGLGKPGVSSSTGPGRPGSGSAVGLGKPGVSSSTGPGRPGISSGAMSGRPSGSSMGHGRPGSGLGTGPGRPGSGSSVGPGRPGSSSGITSKLKCTVVSETISSKNLITRPSNGQLNGMRPPPGHRPPGFPPQGLPRPSLPPISYKRQICDEEDDSDSEMDDFIEDEGDSQEEISKHIREIFGYDRKRYKDESDYALRYMESSWKEQQKEEARSLRLGVQEDLEEMKREEEEWKRKKQAKKLKTN
ncbi:PREDICTED: protein SPT2 homolog [Gavialis gangeticus]|uniref:protein SPT2 homolog n=1 Tax=Gavialis gangeticus TaxID=94835 RepID=UPI00092E66CC|nr:PREDICTED: protein SPT2 homolog [Gavialis gangeticus]